MGRAELDQEFERIFGKKSENRTFCPYRVSPLGAHVDHQRGIVTGLAIDKGIEIRYCSREDDLCELVSVNFEGMKRFSMSELSQEKAGDWADHLRGVAVVLRKKFPLPFGIQAVMAGDLPSGGISSSAAVIIAFMEALCRVNGIVLSDQGMITLAREVENTYVGVQCGILDQSCEVLCRKGKLLYLDTGSQEYELLAYPKEGREFGIGIFFSGLERSLANSKYNLRVDECKSAAYALEAYAEMDYGTYESTCLRDVPETVYREYGERLPAVWKKRADHYFSEMERVQAGASAWKKGDLDTFGRLMFESGRSSIDNYECGCPELIYMYEILADTEGIYGARFSGAGFKGCCVALFDSARKEQIAKQVEERYLARFPELSGAYAFYSCESADGIGKGDMK
ncbi:MAG: galactokinase [Eubacteriales bacterium]|nr:galactokinase [Eubacteriales bacterium]